MTCLQNAIVFEKSEERINRRFVDRHELGNDGANHDLEKGQVELFLSVPQVFFPRSWAYSRL